MNSNPSPESSGPTNIRLTSVSLRAAAYSIIIAAGTWWMLNELASVLRPLLIAIFLGYVLMPYYRRLITRGMPAPVAIILLGGVATSILIGLALAVYTSVVGLKEELLPEEGQSGLQERFSESITSLTDWVQQTLPLPQSWVENLQQPQELLSDAMVSMTLGSVNVAAGGVIEAAAAGLYLLFLLLESTNFPNRVRSSYSPKRAEDILQVFGRINAAIMTYLKAKLISSLVLALPVGIILLCFGVRFALLWTVVTFLFNFIPYIGTVVSYTLPVLFAFLQFGLGTDLLAVAVLVLIVHIVSASVIEPMILGKAVGLSPLVILTALAVWGLIWGVPGMLLAVPLTVVLKIIFENIQATQGLAHLLSGQSNRPGDPCENAV